LSGGGSRDRHIRALVDSLVGFSAEVSFSKASQSLLATQIRSVLSHVPSPSQIWSQTRKGDKSILQLPSDSVWFRSLSCEFGSLRYLPLRLSEGFSQYYGGGRSGTVKLDLLLSSPLSKSSHLISRDF
jgi:hypothetical protein